MKMETNMKFINKFKVTHMTRDQMEVQNDQMGDHGTKLERIEDDPYAFDDGKLW